MHSWPVRSRRQPTVSAFPLLVQELEARRLFTRGSVPAQVPPSAILSAVPTSFTLSSGIAPVANSVLVAETAILPGMMEEPADEVGPDVVIDRSR